MIAGVISDTHGLIRSEALEALAGVDVILHAGDVGKPEVLRALEKIAPVHAVRGNVDTDDSLPPELTVTVGGANVYILHKLPDLGFDPAARGLAAVISGHSHKFHSETRHGVLYLNPGSAGPRRFRLPLTLARMTVNGVTVSATRVDLLI